MPIMTSLATSRPDLEALFRDTAQQSPYQTPSLLLSNAIAQGSTAPIGTPPMVIRLAMLSELARSRDTIYEVQQGGLAALSTFGANAPDAAWYTALNSSGLLLQGTGALADTNKGAIFAGTGTADESIFGLHCRITLQQNFRIGIGNIIMFGYSPYANTDSIGSKPSLAPDIVVQARFTLAPDVNDSSVVDVLILPGVRTSSNGIMAYSHMSTRATAATVATDALTAPKIFGFVVLGDLAGTLNGNVVFRFLTRSDLSSIVTSFGAASAAAAGNPNVPPGPALSCF